MSRLLLMPVSLRADLGLLLTTILWGFTFPLIRVIVQEIPPPWLIAIRFSIALLIFVPVSLSHGLTRVQAEFRRAWKGAALLGALAFGSYLTQTMGLQTIGAGRAAFITGTCVVFVPIIAPLYGKRWPGPADWIACLGATLGLFLLTRPDTGGSDLRGDLWVLACSVICAFYIRSLADHGRDSQSKHTLNLMQLFAVVVLAWTTLPLMGGMSGGVNFPQISAQTWITLGVLAVFLTTFTFILQTGCQPLTTPERAAIIFTMEPVWGSLAGYLLLGETFTPSGYAGAAVILASIIGLELWHLQRSPST